MKTRKIGKYRRISEYKEIITRFPAAKDEYDDDNISCGQIIIYPAMYEEMKDVKATTKKRKQVSNRRRRK